MTGETGDLVLADRYELGTLTSRCVNVLVGRWRIDEAGVAAIAQIIKKRKA